MVSIAAITKFAKGRTDDTFFPVFQTIFEVLVIYWDVSPEIVTIGPFVIRWYGLLFALSFIVGFQIFQFIFKRENRPAADLNDLIWVMIVGTVLGARLGHCFFYNPAYYLSNPLEIIMVWKGGLASHGAAIGILLAIYHFVKKHKQYDYLWVLDRIAITVALAGFFIRTGNLFNSEIIGKPTNLPWAFVFSAVDGVPRHPAQLYEALVYLSIFILLFIYYSKTAGKFKNGLLMGLFLVLVFSFRILVEFIKEDQTYFEKGMILNMGQILSIPFVLLGIYLLFRKDKKVIKL